MILSRAFNRTLILTPLILAVGCDSQPPSSEVLNPAAQPNAEGENTAAIEYPKAGMGTTPGEWDAYGADIGSTKYTPNPAIVNEASTVIGHQVLSLIHI